jgi:hypothetical protein
VQSGGQLGKDLAAVSTVPYSTDDAFRSLENTLGREHGLRAYLRSRPTDLRMGLVLLVALLPAFPAFAHRPHIFSDVQSWVIVLVFLLGVILSSRGALPILGRPRSSILGLGTALGILALPLFLAWFPFTGASTSALPMANGGTFVTSALKCFFYGLSVSVPLAVALWLTSREDTWPLRSLCFAAGAAGIAANLALHAHCVLTHPLHLFAGHATLPIMWLLTFWIVFGRRKPIT